jgi:hypothetical protein
MIPPAGIRPWRIDMASITFVSRGGNDTLTLSDGEVQLANGFIRADFGETLWHLAGASVIGIQTDHVIGALEGHASCDRLTSFLREKRAAAEGNGDRNARWITVIPREQYLVVKVVTSPDYQGDVLRDFESFASIEPDGIHWSVEDGPFDSPAAIGEALFDVDGQ